jgi:NAD(P)-dependent dehydrogenase (short-subunit alcohol dehydrogenase family)
VVAITSHMGSIADITSPRDYAYRSSKAALNAAMRGLSLELAERRVGVLVERFTPAMSGRFFRFDGEELPW